MSGFANTNSTVTSQGWMHHRITVAGSIGQNTSGWSLPSASWSHCAAAGGSYTENMSPGRPQIGTSPSTYTLNYNGSGLSGFNGSVADSGSSDLSSVTSNAVSRINSNSESPMDFTATNESGNSRLKLMTASNGNAPGVWTMGISNAGNISFSDSSESTPGVADTVVTYNAGDGTSDQVYTFTANKTADEAGALLATEFGIEYDSDTNKLKIVKDEEGTTPTLTVTGDSTLSFSYA